MTNAERNRQELETVLKTNLTSGLTEVQVTQRQDDGRNVLQGRKAANTYSKRFGAICLMWRHWCYYLRWRYRRIWLLQQTAAGRKPL